jgi:hypothetical protein
MFTGASFKDMHDDIAEVHQDPNSGFGSFEAEQAVTFFRQGLVHMVCDGLNLAFGVGRAKNEKICNSGCPRNI